MIHLTVHYLLICKLLPNTKEVIDNRSEKKVGLKTYNIVNHIHNYIQAVIDVY